MITVRGKQFSEETIVTALRKHCNFGQPYIFQSGDIVTCNGFSRIILEISPGKLVAFDSNGYKGAVGQCKFEECDYIKVGNLNNFNEEN